ncbi:MAG: outer membrane lipoprotein carrier protein LolA, partial [Herbaspirillum sp.]
VLTFTHFEKNPKLTPEQFKFVVPKGADVFRN